MPINVRDVTCTPAAMFLVVAMATSASADPPSTSAPKINPRTRSGVVPPLAAEPDRSLPPSNKVQAKAPTESKVKDTAKGVDPNNGNECRVESVYRKEVTLEDVAAFNPNSQTLWPGALVAGGGAASGVLTPVLVPRKPVTVWLDGLNDSKHETILGPAAQTLRAARNRLSKPPSKYPAIFSFDTRMFHSVDDAMLSIGASANWLSGNAQATLHRSDYKERSNFLISFVQQYYTYTVDSQSMTLSKIATRKLPATIDPSTNPLAYVASVTYGRRVILTISSSTDRASTEEAAKAAASWAGNSAEIAVQSAQMSLLKQSEIKLLVFGGDSTSAKVIAAENIAQEVRSLLARDPGPEALKTAVPISYKLNYMDHSPMRLALATEFEKVDKQARPTVGAWSVKFPTSADDKDDDSMLSVELKRRSDGAVIAKYSQNGKEAFPNGSAPTKTLAGGGVYLSDLPSYYMRVCISTNGDDHWVFNAEVSGTISNGQPYSASAMGNLKGDDSTECMNVDFGPSPQAGPC